MVDGVRRGDREDRHRAALARPRAGVIRRRRDAEAGRHAAPRGCGAILGAGREGPGVLVVARAPQSAHRLRRVPCRSRAHRRGAPLGARSRWAPARPRPRRRSHVPQPRVRATGSRRRGDAARELPPRRHGPSSRRAAARANALSARAPVLAGEHPNQHVRRLRAPPLPGVQEGAMTPLKLTILGAPRTKKKSRADPEVRRAPEGQSIEAVPRVAGASALGAPAFLAPGLDADRRASRGLRLLLPRRRARRPDRLHAGARRRAGEGARAAQ